MRATKLELANWSWTDRSTSRWKQNQRANSKRKRSRENLQPRSTNLMN